MIPWRVMFGDDGAGVWPDLEAKIAAGTLIHVGQEGGEIAISMISNGVKCASGGTRPSVALRIDLPDGKTVLLETSAAMFLAAADAVRGRLTFLANRGDEDGELSELKGGPMDGQTYRIGAALEKIQLYPECKPENSPTNGMRGYEYVANGRTTREGRKVYGFNRIVIFDEAIGEGR
jgi:hypothetical protein